MELSNGKTQNINSKASEEASRHFSTYGGSTREAREVREGTARDRPKARQSSSCCSHDRHRLHRRPIEGIGQGRLVLQGGGILRPLWMAQILGYLVGGLSIHTLCNYLTGLPGHSVASVCPLKGTF